MLPERKIMLKWLIIGLGILLSAVLGVSFLLNLIVTIMEKKESIVELGRNIDGVGNYFMFLRLSIVFILVVYWKEIVRWYAKWQELNLRQVFVLKRLYPYILSTLITIEVLGLLF